MRNEKFLFVMDWTGLLGGNVDYVTDAKADATYSYLIVIAIFQGS